MEGDCTHQRTTPSPFHHLTLITLGTAHYIMTQRPRKSTVRRTKHLRRGTKYGVLKPCKDQRL